MRKWTTALVTTGCFATAAVLILFGARRATPAQGQQGPELECVVMNADRLPLETRRSPLDSVSFSVGEKPVKLCYSRPSARGRTIMGGLLPYGEIWRTGANEPTMLHTSAPLDIAGIEVAPGSYSVYTVPGEKEWQIILNRSTSQWGHERYYTEEVRSHEIGRATVSSQATDDHVEMFTIRAVPRDGGANLLLEWERTRVTVPVMAASTASGS